MTLIHIDSCSNRSPELQVGPARWESIGGQSTGRDGVLGGCLMSIANGSTSFIPLTAQVSGIIGFASQQESLALTSTGLTLLDGPQAGANQHLTLNFDNVTNQLTLRRGSTSGTIIATSAQVYSVNVWRYWEVKWLIDDTVGVLEVKIDGVVWISYTGDTRNLGLAQVARFAWVRSNATGNAVYVDDLYLQDLAGSAPYNNYLGDVAVPRLLPSGNGSSSQLVGSDGNSTDNYLLVNEATAAAATYVESSTPTQRDLYALGNLPQIAGTVHAVAVNTYVGKSDAGTRSFKALDQQAGSARAQTSIPLSVTQQEFITAPLQTDADGNPWNITRVNSMQVGVEVV